MAFYGDHNSENIVVSWGSPKGAIVEAINILKEEGLSVGFLQVRMISPFPTRELRKALEGKKRIIDIEDNYDWTNRASHQRKNGDSPELSTS